MVFTLRLSLVRPRQTSISFDGENSGVIYSSAQDAKIQELIILGKKVIQNGVFIETKFKDVHIDRYATELKDVDRSNTSEISRISHQILDRLESNKVAQMVYSNKIDQLKDKPEINHTLTKWCVFAVVLAMFAGIIGGASLLSNFHLVPKELGISNISNMVDYGLISFASVVLIGYIITKIAALRKPKSKKAQLSKDIDLTIRNAFLFSNLNDGTASVVYFLAALLILAPHLHLGLSQAALSDISLISKCFGYPTGVLLIASGLQQVGESGIELKNSFKKKNLLNLIRGLAVIFMGYLFIIGFQSHGVGVVTNGILNGIPFAVVGITLLAVRRELKAIKDAEGKDVEGKRFFLEETLSLNEKELTNLNQRIENQQQKEILKWLKEYPSLWQKFLSLFNCESELVKFWKKIQADLEDKRITNERLAQIKKMIIREEIKIMMMKKIDAFSEKIEKDTLQNVLELMQTDSTDKINKVFQKVVKESIQKRNVEQGKALLLTVFLASPILGLYHALIWAYNLSQVILNTFNIGINLTPRYRNTRTANLEKPLNVNTHLSLQTA